MFILIGFSVFADISLDELGNSAEWDRKDFGSITYFTKKDLGKIPVLCFHKIGENPRYEITADNFEIFLKYLILNNFYPLSDKELIKQDFSMVPTGFTPIVLGSDDASEGNFLYKTVNGDSINGIIDYSLGNVELEHESMVYLLNKYLKPSNGTINFTFYISFNGIPFRQTGGQESSGKYYRGLDVVRTKFNYLLDNFIVGIHTTTHPVTKDSSVSDFKWEIDEFYTILNEYVGDKISLIDTIAYPYGCAVLKPEMRKMINSYTYKGTSIIGGFDFDGYFSKSPYSGSVDNYDISRFGVDNQNINNLYGFLENIKLFSTERVIVVKSKDDLLGIDYNEHDTIIVGEI